MSFLKKCYLYLFLFTLIYIEFGYHVTVANLITGNYRTIILLVSLLPFVFFNDEHNNITLKKICLLFLVVAVMLLNLVFRVSGYGNYILWFVPIFVGLFVSFYIEISVFKEIYTNIMYFLSLFSLIVYFINVLNQPIIASLPTIGIRYGANINNAFFSVAITNSVNIRNYGIAWEPGAFALLVGLALYFELFFKEKINTKRVIILTVTVATTFSTMGYFFVGGLYMALLFNNGNKNMRFKSYNSRFVQFFLCFLVIVIFLLLPSELKELVFGKLEGLLSENDEVLSVTTNARIDAIKYPLEAFLSSPIFGIGYDEFSILNIEKCNGVATNTILNWYAVSGITLGVPFTYYYIRKIWLDKKTANMNSMCFIILVIGFLLLVSTESLLRISLIYILIFYGCDTPKENLCEENYEDTVYFRRI